MPEGWGGMWDKVQGLPVRQVGTLLFELPTKILLLLLLLLPGLVSWGGGIWENFGQADLNFN